MPASDSPSNPSLAADDIISVDHEQMILTLAAGPISFKGEDLALSFPDWPAEGVSFKVAGSMYRKETLRATLKLRQNGSRCAESWVPDAKLRKLLTFRHEMLRGEKGDGRFPWYLVSAVFAEFTGEKVNFADELGHRMLQALAALKAGTTKTLKYEQPILEYINRRGAEADCGRLPKEAALEVGLELVPVASYVTEDVVEKEEQEQVGQPERPSRSSKRARQNAVNVLLLESAPARQDELDEDTSPVVETHNGAIEGWSDVKRISLEVARVAVAEQVEMQEREERNGEDLETPPPTNSTEMDGVEPSSEQVSGGDQQTEEEELQGRKEEENVQDHAKTPMLQEFNEMKAVEEGEGNSSHLTTPDEHDTTSLQVALNEAEEKLGSVRKQKDALVESQRQAIARLTELESEQSCLLKEWMAAKEEVAKHVATGNMVVVEGLKKELSCNALQTANLGKMHVKRRRLDEQKVSMEELDSLNRAQIWELEQGIVDCGTSVSGLLEQWKSGYLRFEKAKLAEETASKQLMSTLEIISNLHCGKNTLQEELQKKESEVHFWVTRVMDLKHKLRMAECMPEGEPQEKARRPSSGAKKGRAKKRTR